jgi:hypothetical protein
MAAKLLLPGFGGMYTSESLTASATAGADTIDCSRCGQIAVTIIGTSADGNIDFTQSFNGGLNYSPIISTLTNWNVNTTTTTTVLLDVTDGPFGVWKIDPTDIVSGTAVVYITGFPIQEHW